MRLFPQPHETIEGLAPAIRDGRVRCVDLLDGCLERIEEREPDVRAWVVLDREGATKRARALDLEVAEGRWRGPLHGIPVGIKDIIDVEGMPTAAGFGPWVDRMAREDAPLVARLREAGAVILGKTVTTPFAWIDPPPTRNPWNLDRTPGGSSSGSAAAVAAGMCLAAIGTQTGGSILRPAAFCGVCGLKPTHGQVPSEGIVPLAPSLDHPGAIARSVGDLGLVLDAIAGAPVLPTGRVAAAGPPKLAELTGALIRRAEPEMRRGFDWALAALVEAGATVVEAAVDEEWVNLASGGARPLRTILEAHRTILAAEAAWVHDRWFATIGDDYPPRIRALVEEGRALLATELLSARQIRDVQRELAGSHFAGGWPAVDALAMPTAIGPAPERSTTGDPSFQAGWSFTGQPALTLPIGLSPDGLPLGLQLIGRPGGEAGLLAAAAWCEGVFRRRFEGETESRGQHA